MTTQLKKVWALSLVLAVAALGPLGVNKTASAQDSGQAAPPQQQLPPPQQQQQPPPPQQQQPPPPQYQQTPPQQYQQPAPQQYQQPPPPPPPQYQQASPNAYPQPGYAPNTRRARPRKGMLIAGSIIFGVSYSVALIAGSAVLDSNCCDAVGGLMMIPVVGPYIAASQAENARGTLSLLGTVEVVGAALLIAGAIRYSRAKREAEADGYYSFQLPRGKTLSLDMATSPRMVGPSMRLRF